VVDDGGHDAAVRGAEGGERLVEEVCSRPQLGDVELDQLEGAGRAYQNVPDRGAARRRI
jgi:hypothetical protein